MKNKIIDVVSFILVAALVAFAAYTYHEKEQLTLIISKQNDLIKKTTGKDSEFIDKANDLKDSIKTYTEKITFITGGKEISSSQFIDLYNKLESKNDSLDDKLWRLEERYRFAERHYKFKVKDELKGTTLYLTTEPSTADSARAALLLVRDRLKINKKDEWYLQTPKPDPKVVALGKRAKEIIDSAKLKDTNKVK
ncbi:hypothetical protein B0I27_107122 [Arcticibacter pallidicorallinus]|uniref:Uncharacterized protein n=1 Tax=Arcticibacter pallidicorallinus TaxID=1259464 RepID=A0A2T0U0R1_9SPHI|nr:hypothetical protein [Arcticibacter pallidicorallinus]PRY51536.1 hypothetical protein B0I27_107122 [Arcticibacter pallidicorallinus]